MYEFKIPYTKEFGEDYDSRFTQNQQKSNANRVQGKSGRQRCCKVTGTAMASFHEMVYEVVYFYFFPFILIIFMNVKEYGY